MHASVNIMSIKNGLKTACIRIARWSAIVSARWVHCRGCCCRRRCLTTACTAAIVIHRLSWIPVASTTVAWPWSAEPCCVCTPRIWWWCFRWLHGWFWCPPWTCIAAKFVQRLAWTLDCVTFSAILQPTRAPTPTIRARLSHSNFKKWCSFGQGDSPFSFFCNNETN